MEERLCHSQELDISRTQLVSTSTHVPPPKIDRFSKLDSFKPMLHELMSQGFNCVVLLERLKILG